MLCQLSYTPALSRSIAMSPPARERARRRLALTTGQFVTASLGLAMEGVTPVTGTVFHELDPVRIVLLVLARRVRPLLALGAGELDRRSRLDPGHRSSLLDDADDGAGTDGPATLADGEALADLEGDRGDQLDAHLDVVAGHDHLGAVVSIVE